MYPDRDTFEQLYPVRGTLQHIIKHGGKWHDRRWEKHCQFSLLGMNTTRVHNKNMKPQAKKQQFSK